MVEEYPDICRAAADGDLERVKELVKNGEDVNTPVKGGRGSGYTALIYASSAGYFEIVKLLIENGARVNAKHTSGITSLMLAAYHGHKEIVQYLIDHGAEVNLKDRNGKKAVDYAKDADEDRTEIIHILEG